MMDPTSLEGKLVLVTGAGTGIGQGVALELARRGADVALHYSSSAAGANAAVEQIVATGRRAAAFQGDLSKVEDCRRVVDQAAAVPGWTGRAGQQCRHHGDLRLPGRDARAV